MTNLTEKKVTEILYKNSFDNTEGLIIKFENVQKVIGMLCGIDNAINEDVKVKSKCTEKPPLGIKPLYIHDQERFIELCEAIKRYWEANRPINLEWIQEYNDYLIKYKDKAEFILIK